MKRLLMLVVWSAYACASTYYVSSSTGNDSNAGTSPATAWKTLASVSTGGSHASLMVPGTTVLLARGDVWTEQLAPAGSGASGNPIVFDAYGTGAAPELTGLLNIPTANWTTAGTNQWSAPVTASGMSWVLFGTIWGTKQTTQAALQHDRDFYLYNNLLYVYAPSNPGTYYGSVSAGVMVNTPLIVVSGKSYITFQHLKLDWFDTYGVYVTGASDHLVFANMEVDGMIPAGAMPLGFYVNASSPTDIRFINADAHMCYDGFRFDGTVGSPGASIVNARAYFNRNYGIDDTTGAQHVTYSYSHFYGNGVGVLGSTDVFGAVEAGGAGNGHNLAAYTPPSVNSFARYPARITYTIDDEGKSPGGADFIDSVLPQFTTRNLKLSIAVVTGGTYASGDAARIQGWFNAGHDINSHSWSHNYYDSPVINVRYTGTGTAATLTISGNTLTTSVTGGPGGENLNLDLAALGTFGNVAAAINGRSGYTASIPISGAGTSTTLANVSAVDIKTATYGLMVNGDAFVQDEMAKSKAWLLANVSGLSSSELVYVYPSGKENYQTQLDAVAAGYKGARGSLSMGQAVAGTFTTNSGPAPGESNVRSVYGLGVNVQNITSLGASGLGGMTPAQIGRWMAALVAKAQAWGVPYGLFTHPPETGAPELTVNEIGAVLDGLVAAGATVMTNTQLVDYLASQAAVTGTTFYVTAGTSATVDMGEAWGAPTVLSGNNQGAAYAADIRGKVRPGAGTWDIGAYQIASSAHGWLGGATHFTLGGAPSPTGENAYCAPGDVARFGGVDGPATLPTACIYTAMSGTPSPGTVRTVNGSNCNDPTTGLQATINAAAAGDTIVIPAGTTCQGSYTFPAKSGADRNHWITVRTDQINNSRFPAEGVQATPCLIGLASVYGYPNYSCPAPSVLVPTLLASGGATPLTVSGSYYRFIGIDVTKPYGTAQVNALVSLDGSDHVILDRMLVHGDNWDQHTPNYDSHIGVSTRGTYQAVIHSWVFDIDWNQADSQAIVGGTGNQLDEGPLKLYDNLLAGGSETWVFGGGYTNTWPHDYEIRRNLSMKPLKWMLAKGATSYNVSVNVKNLGEFKHGHRVLYEDNVFINNWIGQADQWGEALLILPKNQSASTIGNKYVNTNGTTVTCAADTSGTPCAAGTNTWGNAILSMSRTNGIVTLNGANNGATIAWPYYHAGGNIVLQGIPSQIVNGVDLASFNGEWTMGCLNATTCTDGYTTPRVIYFSAPGPDFPLTTTGGGLAQDFTASTCATPGHCYFAAPTATYPTNQIMSVSNDGLTLTVATSLGVQTGVSYKTCRPGLAPNAQVQDVTVRYNYISHTSSTGLSPSAAVSDCGDYSLGVSNISVHDNLADDLDAAAWDRSNGGNTSKGGLGPTLANSNVAPSQWPHDITFDHNTWAGARGWQIASGSSRSAGFDIYDPMGSTYYANIRFTNNILHGPFKTSQPAGGALLGGGVVAGFNKYLCSDHVGATGCTWTYKNNLVSTAQNGAAYPQQSNAPYPSANPDASSTCTVTGGCLVTDFSTVFRSWSTGLGDTRNNDYTVTGAYRVAGSDGRDLGANMARINQVKSAVLPAFTYNPLVISTTSLTACTNGVYCEQQLLTSSNAGGTGGKGFVRWFLTAGALPAGMYLANADGGAGVNPTEGTYYSCRINGAYSKTGPSGCSGWIYGTPTQSGSFPLTFQAEDAAHQKASVSLTLVVS